MNLKCTLLNGRARSKTLLLTEMENRPGIARSRGQGDFGIMELFCIMTVDLWLFALSKDPGTVYNKE